MLNDRNGRGVLQDITMYAAGVNDLGNLTAKALEANPQILTLSGVGYEERRSQQQGDYLFPVYNQDATTVWAARKKAGQSTYEIVRLDVATGTESVIATGVSLGSGGTAAAISLLNDKVIWYRTTRVFAGTTVQQ